MPRPTPAPKLGRLSPTLSPGAIKQLARLSLALTRRTPRTPLVCTSIRAAVRPELILPPPQEPAVLWAVQVGLQGGHMREYQVCYTWCGSVADTC